MFLKQYHRPPSNEASAYDAVSLEVLTAMSFKRAVYWNVAQNILVHTDWPFTEFYCLRHPDDTRIT